MIRPYGTNIEYLYMENSLYDRKEDFYMNSDIFENLLKMKIANINTIEEQSYGNTPDTTVATDLLRELFPINTQFNLVIDEKTTLSSQYGTITYGSEWKMIESNPTIDNDSDTDYGDDSTEDGDDTGDSSTGGSGDTGDSSTGGSTSSGGTGGSTDDGNGGIGDEGDTSGNTDEEVPVYQDDSVPYENSELDEEFFNNDSSLDESFFNDYEDELSETNGKDINYKNIEVTMKNDSGDVTNSTLILYDNGSRGKNVSHTLHSDTTEVTGKVNFAAKSDGSNTNSDGTINVDLGKSSVSGVSATLPTNDIKGVSNNETELTNSVVSEKLRSDGTVADSNAIEQLRLDKLQVLESARKSSAGTVEMASKILSS
jgi:hypothetical protein